LFYDYKTGKEIFVNGAIYCCQSLIPQQIEFLEKCNILIICTNSITELTSVESPEDEAAVSSQIRVYKLDFIDNQIICKHLKNVDFDRGKIADIKVFEYFGGGYFLVAAIDNYI
jgi:hypothetical protein